MADTPPAARTRRPWAWVPTLYFAEGIPYVTVMVLSVILYKRLGVSNTDIALYTSWLYLPWVIKPLWSPIVEVLRTKRLWIVAMQLVIGAGLAGVALTIPTEPFFQYTLAFLWLLAFSSATHDIAADGFYLLALEEGDQSLFIGIRSTFYRLAMVVGQGLLVVLAGTLEASTGLPPADLTVRVAAEAPAPAAAPAPEAPGTVAAAPGPLRLVVSDAALALPLGGTTPERADALKASAHADNVAAGHVPPDAAAAGAEPEAPSLWARTVSGPLGDFLRRTVGERRAGDGLGDGQTAARTGATASVGVRLSGPPPAGEQLVVNVGRDDGDAGINVVEGERLTFTAANWSRPARVVFAVDPKLDTPAAATFRATSGDLRFAWSTTFWVLAALFVAFALYHRFALPTPPSDRPSADGTVRGVVTEFFATFAAFFRKPGIGVALVFILFYRFAEAQLVKLASPFLLDTREAGGLALSTSEVGFVYGTVGILALTLGGILGGVLASRDGLRRWFWPMVLGINIPNAVYIYLALARPDSLFAINAAIALEQFGYGFGFTAFLLVLIHFADGQHKTAHYAICTGFMALGMMIPGMFSGWLQEILGYERFFIWVLIATIPSFVVAALVRFPADFGKKDKGETPAEALPQATTTEGAAVEA